MTSHLDYLEIRKLNFWEVAKLVGEKAKMQSASLRVTENVKQAREQALVGSYDDAKVFYGGAIQGIQQLLKEKDDQSMKEKWKQVRYYVPSVLLLIV